MGSNSGNTYTFDKWFSIELPEGWEYENDDEEAILNVYAIKNPKGALQVSFYRLDPIHSRNEVASDFVNRFISQFDVQVDEITRMTIHRDDYVIGMAAGECDGRYLKIWCLTEGERCLMATYNSAKKTREVSVVDDIVFGIKFI